MNLPLGEIIYIYQNGSGTSSSKMETNQTFNIKGHHLFFPKHFPHSKLIDIQIRKKNINLRKANRNYIAMEVGTKKKNLKKIVQGFMFWLNMGPLVTILII